MLQLLAGNVTFWAPIRSVFYYQATTAKEENLKLMGEKDKQYLKYPFFSNRKMKEVLKEQSFQVKKKRVKRLYLLMGFQAIGPNLIQVSQTGCTKFTPT